MLSSLAAGRLDQPAGDVGRQGPKMAASGSVWPAMGTLADNGRYLRGTNPPPDLLDGTLSGLGDEEDDDSPKSSWLRFPSPLQPWLDFKQEVLLQQYGLLIGGSEGILGQDYSSSLTGDHDSVGQKFTLNLGQQLLWRGTTLAGHGVSLRVENGALTIQNGFTHYPQQRETFRYFPGDLSLPERIILIDGSGSISFDVLSWLAEQKVSLIRIDWKGDIVCVAGASGYSANPYRVQWQLETRGNPGLRNEFCRSLIAKKVEATILTLEKSIPRSDKWERAMKSAYSALSRLEENPPEAIVEMRALEANCATSYFRSWGGIPIKWRGTSRRPIPENWRFIGQRSSPIIWPAIVMPHTRLMRY